MNFHKKKENTENNAVQTETSETAKVTRKKGGFKSRLFLFRSIQASRSLRFLSHRKISLPCTAKWRLHARV